MNKPTSIAYIDLLSALVAVFVVLFALVVSQQNQISEGDVDSKAEFIITIEWPDSSPSDVDLWVGNPNGGVSYFGQKEIGFLTLERDNLGIINNYAYSTTGERIELLTRAETTSIRGINPGTYTVNIVLYNLRDPDTSIPVKIQVIKLNPYSIIIEREIILTFQGEESTVGQFTIDSAGRVINVNTKTTVHLTREGASSSVS